MFLTLSDSRFNLKRAKILGEILPDQKFWPKAARNVGRRRGKNVKQLWFWLKWKAGGDGQIFGEHLYATENRGNDWTITARFYSQYLKLNRK
ncbi:MAG: hypothetical protein IJT59_02730 [Desulfovibrionaceae bacterium]|nr:hypothetical protein [Desulfovibrionaceae bacterium]